MPQLSSKLHRCDVDVLQSMSTRTLEAEDFYDGNVFKTRVAIQQWEIVRLAQAHYAHTQRRT